MSKGALSSIVLSVFFTTCVFAADIKSSFAPGEKITYAIKKMGMKAGTATLSFQGPAKIKGRDSVLIVFTAKALNFFDEEKIYVDAKSFYPLVVERNLNIFGKREKITEEYLTEKHLVKISKEAGKQKSEQKIEKRAILDNIYSFIFRYRQSGQFKIGEVLQMHLPTKELKVKLDSTAKLKIAGNEYSTYYMTSDPSQYAMWFDTSFKKIPLRIDGAVGFGDTSMVMVKYEEGIEK